MDNIKKIYVDFYKPIFDETGIYTKDFKHLKVMDIFTKKSTERIVIQLRSIILEKYGDGLFIKAEDYGTFAYINIFVFFGQDIRTMVRYLNDISVNNLENTPTGFINQLKLTSDHSLLYTDHIFDEDIEKIIEISQKYNLNTDYYLQGVSSYERGAGDWNQFKIFVLKGLFNIFKDIFNDELREIFYNHSVPIVPKKAVSRVIKFISKKENISIDSLHLTSIEKHTESIYEFVISNRYKEYIIKYNIKDNEIVDFKSTGRFESFFDKY